jgi:hypothetical protein
MNILHSIVRYRDRASMAVLPPPRRLVPATRESGAAKNPQGICVIQSVEESGLSRTPIIAGESQPICMFLRFDTHTNPGLV